MGRRWLGSRWLRRPVVASVGLVAALAVAGVVGAFLDATATSGSSGEAQAGTLPTGNQPSLSLSGRDVTVQWTQNTPSFVGGNPLGDSTGGGYTITRYAGDALTTPITPGPSCGGTQPSSLSSADPLTCTETSVPTGEWEYTVTPTYYDWVGGESTMSSKVVIAPAAATSVTFVNGVGTGSDYISSANDNSLSFDVTMPATSLSSDTVKLTLSDGVAADNVTASMAATSGAGTVHFTGVDGSGLNDGSITVSAVVTSSYGDASGSTSINVVKDTVAPTISRETVADATANTDGYITQNGHYYAYAQATDAGSGVASVTADLHAITTGVTTDAMTTTGGPWTIGGQSYNYRSDDEAANASLPESGNPYSFTINATDNAANAASANGSVNVDNTGPAGGSVTATGLVGTGSVYSTSTTISLTLDPGTDSGVGMGSSSSFELQRASASLTSNGTADGSCGTYSSYTVIDTGPGSSYSDSSGITSGNCYRYQYVVFDKLGNTTTYTSSDVKVDTTPPSAPTPTLSAATGNSYITGTTAYINPQAGFSGGFTVTSSPTDNDSGIANVTFPTLTGFTSGGGAVTGSPFTTTYAWSGAAATASGSQTISDANNATLTNSASFTVTPDTTAPSGGALSVDGTAATTAGASVFNGTGSYTISAITDYTDSGSGLKSSTLTVETAPLSSTDGIAPGTCGAFGAPTTISSRSVPITQTETGPTCYLYTLTGIDNVGNVAAISVTIKVDTTAPTAPTPTLTAATGNTYINGSTVYINPQAGKSGGFTVTSSPTDPDSGIASVAFPTLTGFTSGGGTINSSPFTTTYAWSGAGATASGSQTITDTNYATLTNTATFTVTPDTTAPVNGAFTANGVSAATSGATTYATGSSVGWGGRSDFSDAGSGIASSTLTVASAPLTSNTCGSYGSPSTLTGSSGSQSVTADNCYLFTLTGTDNVGNSASISVTVIVTGTASKLVFSQQPVGGAGLTEGQNFNTSPTVSVDDSNGNLVGSDTGNVTLADTYTAGNGGTTQGTLTCSNTGFPTITALAGVAAFTNCQITGTAAAGTYTLDATRVGITGTGASNNVVVNAGPATKLVFTTQPTSGQNIQAKGTGSFADAVTVEDANGNVETGDSSTTVTLAINNNPSSGVLSCTNTGGLTVNDSAGVANFTGCAITKAGTGYTLKASSSPSYTAPTNANAFNITAGAATTIAVVSGSGQSANTGTAFTNPLVALVTDTNGNPVSGVSVTFTAPGSGASATLLATTGTCNNSGTSATTCAATTNSSGDATSSTFTANATSGTYNIAATASGTTPNPLNFSETNNASTNTINFTSVGSHTLTIPAGVTSVNFTLIGGGGGGGLAGAAGGAGGSLSGTITLASNPSGTTLTVWIGGKGAAGSASGAAGGAGCSSTTGAYGSGGAGGTHDGDSGGAGGGASCIYVTSTLPIAIAAGGGGGGGGGSTGSGGVGTGGLSSNPGTSTGVSGGNGGSGITGGSGGKTQTSGTFPYTVTNTGGSGGAGTGGASTAGGTGTGSNAGGAGGSGGDGSGGSGGGGGGGDASGGGGGASSGGAAGGGGGGGAGYSGGTSGITVTITSAGSDSNGGAAATAGGNGSASFTGSGITGTPVP